MFGGDIMSFLDVLDRNIQVRGYEYFTEGKVIELSFNGKYVNALVEGSNKNTYVVRLNLSFFKGSSCNCPYAKKGEMCKHMAAVYFAVNPLEAEEFNPSIADDYWYDEYEDEYYDDYDDEDEYSDYYSYNDHFIKPLFYDELLKYF